MTPTIHASSNVHVAFFFYEACSLYCKEGKSWRLDGQINRELDGKNGQEEGGGRDGHDGRRDGQMKRDGRVNQMDGLLNRQMNREMDRQMKKDMDG